MYPITVLLYNGLVLLVNCLNGIARLNCQRLRVLELYMVIPEPEHEPMDSTVPTTVPYMHRLCVCG